MVKQAAMNLLTRQSSEGWSGKAMLTCYFRQWERYTIASRHKKETLLDELERRELEGHLEGLKLKTAEALAEKSCGPKIL